MEITLLSVIVITTLLILLLILTKKNTATPDAAMHVKIDQLNFFLDKIEKGLKEDFKLNRAETNEQLQVNRKELNEHIEALAQTLNKDFKEFKNSFEVLFKDYTEAQKHVGIIKRSSQLALDLLMNLMEWSRSQTGRMKFKPIYFNLEELIQKATLLYQETSERKSIDLVYQLNCQEDVFADIDMISTVLRNLISNAIKFTNVGGKIIISTESTINGVKVSVKDNGLGIPPTKIDELFVVGESHSTSGTNNEKGTGLGLILCKEFIDKNGGEIGVESQIGQGSTFYFILPKREVSQP